MNLIDVHAHLDHKEFINELDQLIPSWKEKGVKHIITSGVNATTNRKALELARKFDIVHASLGLYPIDALAEELKQEGLARDIEPIDVDKEIEFIRQQKESIVAIGECGLDYKFGKEHSDKQKEVFQRIIELAEKINKPLIVHSRKAEFDVIDMLFSSSLKKVVLHCFMGRKHLIKKAADKGYCFSIPPIIVRLQHFQLMAELVPITQLFTETDAPYLSPYPGKRNEPPYVVETVKQIAKIKGFTQEETANTIFMNFQRFFL